MYLWKCSKCGTENTREHLRCWKCEKGTPPLFMIDYREIAQKGAKNMVFLISLGMMIVLLLLIVAYLLVFKPLLNSF